MDQTDWSMTATTILTMVTTFVLIVAIQLMR